MSAFSPEALTLDALRARGEPELFTRRTDEWKAKLVAWFEQASGRTLYSDQTEMFLVEMTAYAFALHGENAHVAILQNLAVFAEGEHLELQAANNSILKLLASPAETMVRFTMAAPRQLSVTIPKGTRCTAGEIAFLTVEAVIIPAGETRGDVVARCTEVGLIGNGYAAGQVTASLGSIVDGLTGTNIAISAGGAEDETDQHLRESTIDGPEAYDRHGGWGGYGLEVRRANSSIVDVAVDKPEAGHIHIIVLTASDDPVGQPLLDQIEAALPPETVRPHGDYLSSVRSGTPHDIDGTLTIRVDPLIDAAGAEADALARAKTAISAMRRPALSGSARTRFAPDTGRLGAQIAPGAITAAAMAVPGVIDAQCDVAYLDLPFDQYPRIGAFAVQSVSGADV